MKVLWEHGAPRVTDAALDAFLNQFKSDLGDRAVQSMNSGKSAEGCRQFIDEQLITFERQEGFSADQLLEARVCAFEAIHDAINRFGLSIPSFAVTDQVVQHVKPFLDFLKQMQRDPAVQRELLFNAAAGGDASTVKWLLDNGAKAEVRSASGLSPLTIAILSKADSSAVVQTVKALVEGGADCNSRQGPDGITPTMFAVESGDEDVLKLILTKAPDVNATNNAGQTAIQWARAKNLTEMVILLKDAGAKE